jgi:hypothetical protein
MFTNVAASAMRVRHACQRALLRATLPASHVNAYSLPECHTKRRSRRDIE